MPIVYDKSRKIFHLQAGDTSYIMQIVKEKVSCTFVLGKTHFFIS